MAKLAPDPLPYGSVARPVRQEPFSYIVGVHWEGGTTIVVELPEFWTYLHSIDPDDPDLAHSPFYPIAQLQGTGNYDIGQIIPKADYDFTLNTTANISASSTAINALASTAGLLNGEEYDITGTGIPTDTTFTYTGGTAGTLDNAATVNQSGTAVLISTKNWLFWPLAPDSVSQEISVFETVVDSGMIETHFEDPDVVFRADVLHGGDPHTQCDDFVASQVALGFITADFFKIIREEDSFPIYYNDAGPFIPGNYVLQVKFRERTGSNTVIINPDKTSSIEVRQIARGGDRGGGRIIPGYPGHNAVIIKSYDSSWDLSFDATWHIVATDPADDTVQDPLWEAFGDLLTPIDGAEQRIVVRDPVQGTSGTTLDGSGVLP